MKCKSCGASLDLTASACPSCGAEVQMGRLTGILGVVCRSCDAYNEPGAKRCAGCGQPLGRPAPPPPQPSAPAPDEAALFPRTPTPPVSPPPRGPAPWVALVPGAPPTGADDTTAPLIRTISKPAAPAAPVAPPLCPATPIPLVTACPSCGEEMGAGQFCAACGQPLGSHGTQVMAGPPAAGQRSATQVFGALEPGRAKLVLERGEGFDGATFRLNAEEVAAGRSKGVVLFPNDPCLAPHHATFFYRGGALHVRDEGAPGGTFLRLRGLSVPLRAGDLFAVGDRLLRFAGLLPQPPAAPPDGTRRLGSPRPHAAAALIEEVLEGGAGGRVYLRAGPSITIGRAGCAINLGDDPYLSQAHAEIGVEPDGTAKLRDLGSSNGTFVRVPAHAARELRDGDCVRMGREVLRVAVAAPEARSAQ